MFNREAYNRYATAKEYVEAIKLVLTSPHYKDKHVMIAIRPTHLLAGFALELYLKAWLPAAGVSSKEVQNYGHKLRDLYSTATVRGFTSDGDIRRLIEHVAEPHGQNQDYMYRYTRNDAEIEPLIWPVVLPIIDKLDNIVDEHVGASANHGLKPGRYTS